MLATGEAKVGLRGRLEERLYTRGACGLGSTDSTGRRYYYGSSRFRRRRLHVMLRVGIVATYTRSRRARYEPFSFPDSTFGPSLISRDRCHLLEHTNTLLRKSCDPRAPLSQSQPGLEPCWKTIVPRRPIQPSQQKRMQHAADAFHFSLEQSYHAACHSEASSSKWTDSPASQKTPEDSGGMRQCHSDLSFGY